MNEERRKSIEESLARARKVVAESRDLIEQAELRIKESDRFLAAQGLTREQVKAMRFTREQRILANEELKRMGLPPLEEETFDLDAATAELRASQLEPVPEDAGDGLLEERRRKFGTFMQDYRL